MAGPEDQGSYVLIMRHFFMAGPEDQEQFYNFLKDSHSFKTGPEDQGSYVLIMRHYFRRGPEDQEPDFDFFERQSLIYDRTRGPGLICFDYEALLKNE